MESSRGRFGDSDVNFQYWTPKVGAQWEGAGTKWLTKQAQVLTIGSCFADNIGRWLAAHGVPVRNPGWGRHYNPLSIESELTETLYGVRKELFWTDDRHYRDAYRSDTRAASLADLRSQCTLLRRQAEDAIRSSTAFVITLGMAELWEARIEDNWVPINRIPPSSMFDTHELRHRMMSVMEVSESLGRIITLSRTAVESRYPIIFTVSPIPLKATFLNCDVRIANNWSKAVLLAGLHEALQNGNENVHYFHAFDKFQHADPKSLWQSDGRHPTREAVISTCVEFVQAYAIDPSEFAHNVVFEVPIV